jgi:FixJ family two-component response regulator
MEPERPLSIAIVDDEPSVRVSLRRLCNALGMRASVYASGAAFLDSLADGSTPDCVLLDMHMPEMTGLDVQRQLSARGSRIPIIVVTADDSPEANDRGITAGAFAFLRKPIGIDELVCAVNSATRRWRDPE